MVNQIAVIQSNIDELKREIKAIQPFAHALEGEMKQWYNDRIQAIEGYELVLQSLRNG